MSLRKKPESVVTLSQLQANSYVTSLRWLGEDFSLQCSWSTKWRIISTPWFILTALWIKLAPCGFAALLNLKFISVTESDWNYVLRKRWLKSTCAAHMFSQVGKGYVYQNGMIQAEKKAEPVLPEAQNTHIQIKAFQENVSMFEEGNTWRKARMENWGKGRSAGRLAAHLLNKTHN